METRVLPLVAACLVCAGVARAQDGGDPAGNCESSCVQDCLTNTTNSTAAAKCGRQCVDECRVKITATQNVFTQVIATPVACSDPQVSQSQGCSFVQGKVTQQQFCDGGTVSILVVHRLSGNQCNPSGGSVDVVGTATVGADCSFSMTVVNDNAQDGHSYGLMAVDAPPSIIPAPPDPGWNTCTSDCCPAP